MIEYDNLHKVNKPYAEELKKAFGDVLDSGWFILGENVERFKKEFVAYNGVKYCAGVASGLDALILSILQNGHKPVLVEPDMRSFNIDPSLI